MASSGSALPIIDLSDIDNPEMVAALRDATHEVGFFYLTGHGIDPQLTTDIIAASRKFFALDEAEKKRIDIVRSAQYRGYTPVGNERTEGKIDWREQMDFGDERELRPRESWKGPWDVLVGPNQWPTAVPELRGLVLEYQERAIEVGFTLMRAWARSLGQDEGVFDPSFFDRPSTLLKVVRYPGHDQSVTAQGVGSHNDPGVLTLLHVEQGGDGLQVERDGGWIDVSPIPGHLIVNIGEMLEIATNGYLKATMHRVLPPAPGTERYSMPFFFNPSRAASFPTLELPPELAAEACGVTENPDNPLHATYGLNELKARLRAHPDVTAAHHQDLMGVDLSTL
ncbi:isopenicillin N synthase family dioxygenase [Tomitella biformata]|uniref:isopenicillin N synthase family dioxygenase n=1 Tax=Tomitella biformata TaxID=630403 RepID=UPI0004661A7E|nr:2-oxoglutarate and iron-dependent oxygenase domain-containing protein [Tomitella biformata]